MIKKILLLIGLLSLVLFTGCQSSFEACASSCYSIQRYSVNYSENCKLSGWVQIDCEYVNNETLRFICFNECKGN